MKISVTVSGPAEANSSTVQCCADMEVEFFDQPAIDRLVHAGRQCAAVVRGAISATHDASGSQPAGPSVGHSTGTGGNKRLATEKQVKAIKAMAGRQGIELASILRDRFAASEPSALSIREASTVIDELKSNFAST